MKFIVYLKKKNSPTYESLIYKIRHEMLFQSIIFVSSILSHGIYLTTCNEETIYASVKCTTMSNCIILILPISALCHFSVFISFLFRVNELYMLHISYCMFQDSLMTSSYDSHSLQ
jgi:hypothetical protein